MISIFILGGLTLPIAEFEILLSGAFLPLGNINSLDLFGLGMVLLGSCFIISESRNEFFYTSIDENSAT